MSKVKLLSLTISDCFFSISFSPEVLQFLTRFCNSYLIIALLMFLQGNKDWDSLLCHLADIIDKNYWKFSFFACFFPFGLFPFSNYFMSERDKIIMLLCDMNFHYKRADISGKQHNFLYDQGSQLLKSKHISKYNQL